MCRHVKYGTMCGVDFELTGKKAEIAAQRPNALFTNVLTPFGRINFKTVHDRAEFDGFNVQLINEYGTLDQALLTEQLKKSALFKPVSIRNMASNMASECLENHVGVLFNLLRMKIIKDIDISSVLVKNSDIAYNDGHVAQSYRAFLNSRFEEKFAMEFDMGLIVSRHSESMRLDRHDYLPNLSGFTPFEISILGMALSGWKCDYPLRVASSTPQICNRLILQPGVVYGPFIEPVEYTAVDVETVLRKLIANNRIEAQFDLAYTLVASILYTPLPRAVEANGWVSPVTDFSIPMASAVRGALDEFTEGNPYQPRPSALATWETYKLQPTRIYVHALGLTEALYTGLFEVLTNRHMDTPSSFARLGMYGAGTMKPYRFIMECCSYRFGKQFELKWNSRSGPSYAHKLLSMAPAKQNDIYVDIVGNANGYNIMREEIDGQQVNRVVADSVKPVLFPVLSLGVNDDRFYMNALDYMFEARYSANMKAWYLENAKQANKAMSILRIAGWDAACVDTYTGERYKNWAANANGQVMPMIRDTTGFSKYMIPAASLVRRDHCWLDLPLRPMDMKIRVKLDIKSYAIILNGRLVNIDCGEYSPVLEAPKVYSPGAATEVVLTTSGKMESYDYSDFTLVMGHTAEQPNSWSEPVGTPVLQSTEESTRVDEQQDVYAEGEDA